MKPKMLAILVHLSMSMWNQHYDVLPFDDSVWDTVIHRASELGFNTIVLDVGDGVQYASHPEISAKGAWSAQRVKKELKRCKALGLTLLPKLNFSATHDYWLGEYRNMLATETYHNVTADIIHEIYELFEQPEYIHLGMDEENEIYVKNNQRPGELYWKDIKHLVECVKAAGSKPWIWADPLFEHTQEYAAHFDPEEILLSPWYYHAFREEHYTPTDSAPEYISYYGKERFAKLNLRFVEEDPFHSNFRAKALPLMEKGYRYVPCASVFNHCKYNTPELVEYFSNGAPADQLLGFMTAPWFKTDKEHLPEILNSLELMHDAVEKFRN